MSVSPISQNIPNIETRSPHPVIDWNQFNFQTSVVQGDNEVVTLQVLGNLKCMHRQQLPASKWESRKQFIEKVVEDVRTNYPKNEPLILVSLGSHCLLTEYILGKTLIKNGFHEISFILIDPMYAIFEPDYFKDMFTDFRERIESDYLNINKHSPFSQDRIRFLSSCREMFDIQLPSNANVVLIESLPPDTEARKEMQKYPWTANNEPDLLLMGGRIVSPECANAIAFIPKIYVQLLEEQGVTITDELKLIILKRETSSYCINWGCKIFSNGTFDLSFLGYEDYLRDLNLLEGDLIELQSGHRIPVPNWIPLIDSSISDMLFTEIKKIQDCAPQKELTQQNLTALLESVRKMVLSNMNEIKIYFLNDYGVDRKDVVDFIKRNTTGSYRKIFSLEDKILGPRISIRKF